VGHAGQVGVRKLLGRTTTMTDQNYEIDIEPGRDDDEMQVDSEAPAVKRRGRGFAGNNGENQLNARNGKTSFSANSAHSTAVRCESSR
jgi:hypothetical protein